MPSLGSLWYTLGIDSRQLDAELKAAEAKLKNLGVTVDVSTVRKTIEASVGATPFNATVSFGNARASLDAVFANKKYDVHVEAIASKLHKSIKSALEGWRGAETSILPRKKELRKAVSDALLSAGFEINVGKVKGLNATINNALGSDHTLNVTVDPKKLASAIDKAVGSYKGGKQISVEAKDKVLKDSIRAALKTEQFPIRVIVDKAEAQDAVRQALQAAGLQSSTGFTASDKRAWDAQSRRMEAEARVAAASALAQRRLAGAHNTARAATDSHIHSSISLGSAMRGNIRIAGELGPMLASAYSVVALKDFMQKVIDIGGELEKQKLAMKAILGDEGMANAISSQINTLAVKSPFGIMELNQYAKQLTAFQIPYNELYDTMKRMADVSAAVGVDMGRIILAYGQVRAAKFLKGTELRQFTEANIPLIDMLAERFTKLKGEIVSAGDIMDMISNKEISFEDVKAVLWELTGEGGRFYNMQEVLSESLQAKWKNLADAIDLMFADIADSLGGPLKGLAEVLTELTSKWQTIAVAVGTAVSVFGVAKVSTLAWNAALSKTTLSAIAESKATKLMDAAKLKVASTYRTLTAAEQGLIRTKGKLTAAQYTQLAATGRLTKEETLRLIALKKLDANAIGHLRNVLNISKAEVSAAQATKAWRVRLMQLKVSLAGVGRSVLGAFLNPVSIAMAAIGTVMTLWQKNSEEMQKAKEMGEDLFTASTEGAKNLGQLLDSFPVSGRNMGEVELSAGVDKLKQAIKDYSKTADKDLLDALVNQKGEVASLAEQYDNLREKAQQLYSAMNSDVTSQISKTLADAVNDASGGWFDDNLLTDIEDYSNAFEKSQKYLGEAVKENRSQISEMVEKAKELSPTFANVAALLKTDEQAFAELIRNFDNYSKDLNGSDNPFMVRFNSIDTRYKIKFTAEREEFEDEFRQTIQKQLERLAIDGITPENKTDEQRLNLIAWFNKVTASLPEEGKRIARGIFENMWQIDLDDGQAERAIIDAFGRAFEASHPELAKRLKAGLQIGDMELIDYASATTMVLGAADEVVEKMPQFRDKIQGFLNDNTFYARVLVEWQGLNQDSDLKKMLWSSDEKNLVVGAFGAEKKFDQMSSGAKSSRDVRENYIKEGKDLKERIKAAKSNNAAAKELASLNAEWDILADSYRRAHFGNLEKDIKEKGRSGTQKDEFAESLKQRFKDIKDAWSEFQKWSKTEGREAAATRIGKSGLFSTLSVEQIPQTVEQYRALVVQLENELRSAGIKGTARESLLNDLLKQLLDIDKTVADEQLKLALDKVSKEAERQLADWNLFDKIRKATGNQDLAMSIAFGMNVKGETDYPALVKKQFAELAKEVKGVDITFDNTTLKQAKDLGDEIAKSYQDTASKLEKYAREQKDAVVDILNEYQSLQDKLTKIDADRDRKIKTVQESDMSAPDKAKYIQRINVEADYQKFTQSNEYLQFFAGIYALTEQEATRIGDLIEQHLNRQLQLGRISAEDYYKEIERIKQQLDKLRNVKSDAMTFLTGGVKGLSEKRQETNNAKRLEITQKIADLESRLQKAREEGDMHQEGLLMAQLRGAKEELVLQDKIRDKIIKNKQQWQSVLDVANIVSNIAGGLSDAFGSIKDMADAFGVDTETGGWLDVGGVLDTLSSVTSGVSKAVQSAMSGDVGGILGGVVSTLTTPFTIWAQLHDKKLQKQIEEYSRIYDLLDSQLSLISERLTYALGSSRQIKDPQAESDRQKYYAALQRAQSGAGFSAQIGGITAKVLRHRVEAYEEGGVYAYQRALMEEQRSNLISQRNAEADKKDSDQGAIDSYNSQIASLEQQIRDFAETAIETLYGINLRSFAEDIGSALIDAFAKGEDAAEAFDEAVGDIMRDVVKQMAIKNILEQQFEGMRTFLFGTDGMSGAFGEDFELDAEEAAALKTYFDKIKNEAIPAVQKLFDGVNDATGGLLEETDKAKSGLTAGIQAMTESTGDLVASYLNGIRGDVSVQTHELWPRLLDVALPQISVIAQSQLDAQRQIAENTLRNAVAAEAIVKSNNDISRLLTRVSQGGAKFHIQ